MIKTIAYFPLQVAQNAGPVYNAVLDCLQANQIQTQENSMNADAAVIWSVLWHGRMAKNELVYRHYRAQNKPVLIIEVGALYRGTTWKLSLNNITSSGFYGHHDNLDWDRPKKLKISLAEQPITKPHILIAGQHRSSLQVENINLEQWIAEQITNLQAVSDRPIVVRPHPRCRLKLDQIPKGVTIEDPAKIPNTYDSFDMHYDCHAVINYNSGPGIQAAISGIRPIVDNSSLAHPVSIDIANIEDPYTIDRDHWLVEICHTEYTLEEIQRGTWLKRLTGSW